MDYSHYGAPVQPFMLEESEVRYMFLECSMFKTLQVHFAWVKIDYNPPGCRQRNFF